MDNEIIDPVCGKHIQLEANTPSSDCGGRTVYFCSRACQEKFACHPQKRLTDYTYALIIVGGGPAGMSAGIYAALTDIDTLLLTKSIGDKPGTPRES